MLARCLLLAIIVMLAAPAAATEPPTPDEIAAKLHDKARRAYKRGRRGVAVELWRAAESAHPFWKYAYNLANVLYETRKHPEAWQACQRAAALGMPAKYAVQQTELRAKIEAALLKTHAFVALTVQPADARATRDGADWEAPRRVWLTTAKSTIEVVKTDFEPTRFVWSHAIGKRHQRTVTLKAVKKPEPPPPPLVDKTPPVVDKAPIVAKAPEPEPPIEAPVVTSSMVMPVAGWSSLAAGLGGIAAGAVFFAQADGLARDAETLNETASDFDAYSPEYDRIDKDRSSALTVGGILTGIGAAAAITGAVLLILDASEDVPSATVAPMPTPGGGGIQGVIRF